MEDRVGHNNPPDMTHTAAETMNDLSTWMAEHPVVQSMDEAREAKVYIDRAKLCIKDLEDERDGKVRPLNEQVKEINTYYKSSRLALDAILNELEIRVTRFAIKERMAREKAANDAAILAQEYENAAMDAEQRERDAIESANAGELGLNVAAHIMEADSAFSKFEKASRQAAIAEKETNVKIGGGFSRAISLRSKETLILVDHNAAIVELGLTEDIREAILKSARAYRRLRGKLPAGITVEISESL